MSEAMNKEIQNILQFVDDPHWLEKLQVIDTDAILPKLLEVLSNETLPLRERGRAAIALGHLQDTRSTNALVALLDSSNDILRAWSATALGKIGTKSPEVLEQLVKCLTDQDAYVRQQVAASLGELKATEALASLRDFANHENDETIRRTALDAVDKIERGA